MLAEKIIEARETTLANLFSENFIFNIPIFQRPLSWTLDNFEKLFEDIKDSMNLKEGHFLGSIILQQHEERPNTYDLIDGQQRIIALTILLAVIRDITNNNNLRESIQTYIYQKEDPYKGLPEAMRVTPWKELKDLFREYVYTPNGTQKFLKDFKSGNIRYKDTEDPRYHLWEAIDIFSRKIREIVDLESFVKHLLRNVYVVYIKTTNLTTAYRLFNVLNTRGLPLAASDLLKSENLGWIKDEEKRKQYGKIWRDIEEELGREELANVIRYIRLIKRKEKARLGIYEEYQRLFKKNGILKRGEKFIEYLRDVSNIYAQKVLNREIIGIDEENKNRYRVLIKLMYRFIPFSDWVPPLLAFYQKYRSDEQLVNFLLKLEKKVVTEWIASFTPSERITSMGKLIGLIEKTQSPQGLMDTMLKSPNYSFTQQGYKDEKELLRQKLDDVRFYSVRGGKLARYILLRIDMSYWELENFSGYPGKITVEHILPQNPPDSEWTRLFTREQRDEWTNKLGNLVLLSGRKNSRAQNYNFKKKKEVYFKEKCTPFRITQELEKINVWNLERLSQRHQQLIDRCVSIYSKI